MWRGFNKEIILILFHCIWTFQYMISYISKVYIRYIKVIYLIYIYLYIYQRYISYISGETTCFSVTYFTVQGRLFLFLYFLFLYMIGLPLCSCFFVCFDSVFGILHFALISFGFKNLLCKSLHLSCLVFLYSKWREISTSREQLISFHDRHLKFLRL